MQEIESISSGILLFLTSTVSFILMFKDQRGSGSMFHAYAPADDLTSTFTPLGSNKEVEYFFASDARYITVNSLSLMFG